ncbi:hypothetical protein ABT144_14125 [Streptomyces sp. NPDC002039]|uniref:hypothetical protein n=1 Tax=Streptomyces sp. NPDC002039 TaxID=3154660 RepID=UPI00332D4357
MMNILRKTWGWKSSGCPELSVIPEALSVSSRALRIMLAETGLRSWLMLHWKSRVLAAYFFPIVGFPVTGFGDPGTEAAVAFGAGRPSATGAFRRRQCTRTGLSAAASRA